MKWEEFVPFAILGVFSLGLFYLGMSQWLRRKSCKEQITGICIKKREQKPGTNKVYYCEIYFEYSYNGKKYGHYAIEQFKGNKQDKFQEGFTYPLYINPQKPENIRCTNQVFRIMDFIYLIVGGFFLLALTGMVIEQILNWVK